MVQLSKEDWVEIYYAVESKRLFLERDHYCGRDLNWVGHLKNIMEIIGPDGETAAQEGVASTS